MDWHGTRGGREWIMWAVHSPFARVVTHPFVAAANFILSLWAFYFTDLVRWSMYEHLGHEWMVIHFLLTGTADDGDPPRPSEHPTAGARPARR